MTGDEILRAVAPTDAGRIAALETCAFEVPWSAPAVEALLADGLTHGWVVTRAGEVVAAALLRVAAGEGELLRIAVHPDARRQGLGRRLLRDVLAAAVERCPDGVYLEVRASNVAARHLYAREGFVEQGRRRDYYQAPREDAILMRWRPVTRRSDRI